MKSSLAIFFTLLVHPVFSQPVIKLYGYSQEIYYGIVPQRDIPSEDGEVTPKRANSTINFYLYVAVNASTKITPLKIFIKDQWYEASNSKQVKTPVTIEMPSRKTLVAGTKMKVLQFQKADSVTVSKPSSSLKKMMKGSEMILCYSWKGRVYYAALKKITILEPVHAP
jgi:hypothetical protein